MQGLFLSSKINSWIKYTAPYPIYVAYVEYEDNQFSQIAYTTTNTAFPAWLRISSWHEIDTYML